MFTPTEFYPANIINNGTPSLFTNKCETAYEAKKEVQKLIDTNSFGTANHVIAGFAYFNEAGEITYVFTTKEEMNESLAAVKMQLLTGATRKHAKLKGLKESAIFALNFLNMKDVAKEVLPAKTFKELSAILA